MSDDERQRLVAPPCSIRVLEDRAFVRREGTVRLSAGLARLRVDDVAPVLVDKTLEAKVEGATLVGLRVRRAERPRAEQGEAHAALEALRRTHEAEIRRLDGSLRRLGLELTDVQRARVLLASELADDVAWGLFDAAKAAAAFDRLDARALELAVDQAEVSAIVQPLRVELTDVLHRLDAARHPSLERRTWIELDIDVAAEGEVALSIGYLVPSAAWRPQHRATLSDDGARLGLESEACVWQRTGEDWSDVELVLSTERPSLGLDPPPLTTDRLETRRKPERVEVEARVQTLQTTGLGAGAQTSTVHEVPGVDDGGEPRALAAARRATIPSDGRPHRVSLSRFEVDATFERVLIPEGGPEGESTPWVVLRSRHVNASGGPLLPGPVELSRANGLVGRSELEYVAAGDRFELGWGPEPAVRVRRRAERLDTETKLLSSWGRIPHRVKLDLSHVGDTPVSFEIVERIPVSEIADVKVELDGETSPGASADDDGFVRWQVRLTPAQTQTLELCWTLAKRDHVQGL